MPTEVRVHWSLWHAALWGCLPSALLLVRSLMLGEAYDRGGYEAQTLAGEIAYWFGYLGLWPILFVIIAAIRNALTPKVLVEGARQPSAIGNFFWPNRIKPEPKGVARFGRVLHWLFAAGALAFVVGGSAAIYYGDVDSGLAAIAFGGGFCFFAGRALRYIFAGE